MAGNLITTLKSSSIKKGAEKQNKQSDGGSVKVRLLNKGRKIARMLVLPTILPSLAGIKQFGQAYSPSFIMAHWIAHGSYLQPLVFKMVNWSDPKEIEKDSGNATTLAFVAQPRY